MGTIVRLLEEVVGASQSHFFLLLHFKLFVQKANARAPSCDHCEICSIPYIYLKMSAYFRDVRFMQTWAKSIACGVPKGKINVNNNCESVVRNR